MAVQLIENKVFRTVVNLAAGQYNATGTNTDAKKTILIQQLLLESKLVRTLRRIRVCRFAVIVK